MGSSEHTLTLIRCALDEFEDRPLDASVRRAIRIANLLGESRTAIRLALDLRPVGGGPGSNSEDLSRLELTEGDSSRGDARRQAVEQYLEDRAMDDGSGRVDGHSIAEFEFWHRTLPSGHDGLNHAGLKADQYDDLLRSEDHRVRILARIRHKTFTALCEWERQLAFSDANARIFERFQISVDGLISKSAPELLDTFNAVYRRLRDAREPETESVREDLTQAVLSCRRILKAVVDLVLPPEPHADGRGYSLGDEAYRNRIREFAQRASNSDTVADGVRASLEGLYGRFEATDKLAHKGVHSRVALGEAELCAINTYVLVGEILRLSGLTDARRTRGSATATDS